MTGVHPRRGAEPDSTQTDTLQLSDAEGQALRDRLGADLLPDGAEAPASPRASGREESQPAIHVTDEELQSLDPVETPAARRETVDSETDFSDVAPAPEESQAQVGHRDHTPTVIPPARPPVGPPPLPSQRREGSSPSGRTDLRASIDRSSTSAEPFLLMRRRVREIETQETQAAGETGAVEINGASNYQSFASNIDRFFLQLFSAHRNSAAEREFFDIEIHPEGEMRIIDGALMFLHENQGYSYFSLRRRMPDLDAPNQASFHLDRIHLSDAHQGMNWHQYLEGIFPRLPRSGGEGQGGGSTP